MRVNLSFFQTLIPQESGTLSTFNIVFRNVFYIFQIGDNDTNSSEFEGMTNKHSDFPNFACLSVRLVASELVRGPFLSSGQWRSGFS
jgi:hypothetical protein